MTSGGSSEIGARLAVACPRCGRKLQVLAEHAGRRFQCPDCQAVIAVPARRQAAPPDAIPASGSQSPATATPPQAPADRLLVVCPECEAQFLARREHAGRPTRCGKCGAQFAIPRPAPEPEEIHAAESYALGEVVARPLAPIDFPQEPRAIAERISTDAPPPRPFLSGVFGFPFRDEARIRLVSVVFLYCILAALLAVVGYFLIGEAIGVIGAGFFALASLWMAVITFGFASACMRAIIEETAAGSDEVSEWPDADWKMWLFAWFPMVYLAFVSAAIGYGAYLLLSLWIAIDSWPVDVALFVLFPFLLLSSLECDSTVAPFSGPVAASLFRHFLSWVAFYALVGLLAISLFVPAGVLGYFVHPLLGVLYFAPAAAVATFIYARLLGRLAWRISTAREDQDDETEDENEPQ